MIAALLRWLLDALAPWRALAAALSRSHQANERALRAEAAVYDARLAITVERGARELAEERLTRALGWVEWDGGDE